MGGIIRTTSTYQPSVSGGSIVFYDPDAVWRGHLQKNTRGIAVSFNGTSMFTVYVFGRSHNHLTEVDVWTTADDSVRTFTDHTLWVYVANYLYTTGHIVVQTIHPQELRHISSHVMMHLFAFVRERMFTVRGANE